MDVKYIPADWEKMRDGIGDLIGLGRWGKGMIDELKDLSDNLDEAEDDIAKYDSDGVISFHHTSQKDKYQELFEDFKVLHSFAGKVGDIVDRTIDQPFYEDMDEFVEAMRDLSISTYTTQNRIGVTEVKINYSRYGPQETLEVPKTEVNLDDLFSGDNRYANQIKLEYDAWKETNPDQDFTQKEYQQAIVNMRAFEYESIRNQQENKEFWVHIGALVVVVAVTVICPPAGLALGVAYGSLELSSAVSGNDWVSGRELGTQERWVRGLLSPIDIIPGVGGLTKFSRTVHVANLGSHTGALGLRTGVRSSLQQGATHLDNLVKTASEQSVARLRSAASTIKDAPSAVKDKLVRDAKDIGEITRNALASATNIQSTRRMNLAFEGIDVVDIPIRNTDAMGNTSKDTLSKIDEIDAGGLNKGGAGKHGFDATSDLKGFSEKIPELLTHHRLTLEDFHNLRLKSVSDLTDSETKILKDIRDSVQPITNETLLQKTLPINDIEKYLSGQYTEVGGYVAKVEDVADIRMYDDVVETSRLDYTTWDGSRPYPEGANSYAMIRFQSSDVNKIEVPYGERFGGTTTDGPPCTQNGFTAARNGKIVPEWKFNGYFEPKNGAELYEVIDGEERLLAVYNNGKFVSVAK